MSRIRFFLTSLLIVWSAGFSLPGFADDTELYLQQAETIDDSVRPNILFVFDKSGSMGSKDVTTASGGTETRMDALKGALTRLLSEGSNDAIKNVNIGLESFTSDPPSTTNGIWNTPILYPVKNIDAPLFANLKFSKPALASSDDAVESGNADKAVTVDGKILEMTASQGGDALAQSTVVEAAVSASNEDAIESLFSRTTTITGTVALGTSATNTTSEVYAGLMFSGLNIPKDATITGARLLLTGYATSCNCALTPVDLEVKGFLTTQKFASSSSDISSRAATTASVNWSDVPAWGTDIVYSSPDLSPIVQELINTAALSSSNSLGFRIVRTPAYTAANPENASNIGRRFYSYDESTTKAAKLQISYTLDTDPTAPDTGSAAGLLQELKTAQLPLLNTADDALEYVGKKVSGDTTVTWSTKYNSNDAVESKYTGHVDTGRTPYLGYDSSFSTVNRREMYTGLRFSGGSNVSGGVGIPKNAVISSAVLTFTPAANATTTPLNLTIKGFAHDNTPVFAGNSQDISGRATTTASVAWNDVSSWSKNTVSEGTRSPDISVIVQELVNRSGWSGSSALGLVIARKAGDAPTSGTVTSGSGRSFYDDGSAKATTLTITYSLSAAGAGAGVDPTGAGGVTNNALHLGNKDCIPNVTGCALQQLVGLRFVNLPVSKAAKVMKAEIQTQVKPGTGTAATAAANISIYTENTVNAPAFATTNGNLSSRLAAGADPGVTVNSPVTWSIASDAGLTLDEKIYTPSLSALLQPLVDTATWNDTSNAVTFLLGKQQAGGGRAIYDYTDSTSKSAKLNLSWLPAMPAASNQIVGLRFPDVVIPKKAKVTSARLVFTSGANTAAANLKIKGLLGGEAAPFVATPGNISSRTATTGEVAWNDTTPWVNGQRYNSPDLTAIVQEIVNSADWCGGYAMGFKITADAEEQLRNAMSFDGNPGDAPTLEFEYDSANLPADTCMQQSVSTQVISVGDDGIQTTTRGGSANDNAVFISGSTSDKKLEMTTTTYGGSTIRIVGFRFQKIPVSPNSEILSARLVFNAMADDNSDAAFTIKAEKNASTGTSASFSENTANFSNRTMTTATVNWNINGTTDPWQNGKVYESPDLTALVQEVVNSPKWVSKNNMSFFISGTGLRTIAAFDQSPALAATLIIKVRGSLDVSTLKKVRTLVLDEVLAMQPDSYTPVVDALMEAAYYFRGEAVTTGANNNYGAQYVSTGPAPLYWLSKRKISHYLTFTSADRSIQGVDLVVDTKDYSGTHPYKIAATERKCTEQMVSTTYPTTCGKKIISVAGSTSKTPVPAKYVSPITSRCQPNHIVLMTDGEPTFNSSAAAAATLTSTTCSTGTNKGRCGPEIAKFLYTQNNGKDAQGAVIPNTTVKTHTVAFKLDATGGPYLKSIATAGGGGFYAAETADELVTAFRSIIAIAMTESTSFAAPSLSVNAFNKLYHDNEVYFALFKPEHKITWAGNVKKFKLCDSALEGTTGCALGTVIDKNNLAAIGADGKLSSNALGFWTVGTQADGGNITQGGAGAVIPSPDTRKIYTNPGATTNVDLTAAGSALTLANTAVTSALLTSTDIPITDTERPALINWIRGYSDATVTPPVVRNWRFGDPLHSSPTVFSYKNGTGTKFTKILTATNEGAIRLLNADDGVEEWMYIPKEMLAIQAKLRENAASSERLYGIDGKPALWVKDHNNNGIIEGDDKIYAFIGMRRGGKNIYALDLTPNADGSVSPKLMWTIYGGQGDFANLGQTWSTPLPVSVNWTDNKRKTVLLFGGGYDDATQDESQLRQTTTKGNSIYMVDPLTGARLWWAGGSVSANLSLTHMDYPIPSDLAVMDSDGDGLIDRIYVGDTGGQLWRVDLDINHVNGKKGVGGRLAAIADGTSPENIRRFFYPPDITRVTDAEYSPDAPNFDLVVIGSGYRSHPLNVTIQDRLYGFRDRVVAKLKDSDKNGNADVDAAAFLDEYQPKGSVPLTNSTFTLAEEHLYDATTDVFSGNVDQTTLDGAKLELQRRHGWYVKLAESSGAYAGEKSLARPLILKGVAYFTTFTPPGLPTAQSSDSNVCMSLGEGVAKVYAIGIQNAGVVTNLDDDADDERSVIVGAGIPAEVIPIYLSTGDEAGEIALGVPTGGGFPILPGTVRIQRESVYWLEE